MTQDFFYFFSRKKNNNNKWNKSWERKENEWKNELLNCAVAKLVESVKPLYMSSIKKHSRIEYRSIECADWMLFFFSNDQEPKAKQNKWLNKKATNMTTKQCFKHAVLKSLKSRHSVYMCMCTFACLFVWSMKIRNMRDFKV